jgi:hypothetical protein
MKNVVLTRNMHAYETLRPYLERMHMGKWVLFRDAMLISSSSSLEAATKDATDRFGRDECLVIQVAEPNSN